MKKKYCVYGEWRESKTDIYMSVTDSNTGEVIAEVPRCTQEEVEIAITSAQEASPTPLTAIRILGLFYTEAGFPKGVVNLVTCSHHEADILLTDPRVKAVTFVGTTGVGKEIYSKAAANGKRVQAQCGAKNHALVLEDADLENSVNAVINSSFGCRGMHCMALPVICVQESIADQFVALLKKKSQELVVGWAAMRNNPASASIVIVITMLTQVCGGIEWAITIIGCMMILLCIGAMLIPDTPQEAGENPANLTDEEAALAAEGEPPEQGTQTYRCFLRTRKFWFVSLGVGIYMMVTVGVISQLILRLTSIELSRSAAMIAMSVCALIGTVGSYLWGMLDQKCSTKNAAALYGVWYATAVALNMVPNRLCIYLSILMHPA